MILPECVKVCSGPIADHCGQLMACEREAVENACEKRRNEFSTGRYLLRRLFSEFGLGGVELPKGSNGGVILPAGYCGSIAHTGSLCVAALTTVGDIVSIGIDVETIGDVGEQECCIFMPQDEYDIMFLLEPEARQVRMAAAFSVREAIYKCLNPVFGRWIDFQDARVSFSDDGASVAVKIKNYEGLSGLECRYEAGDNMVFASAVLYKCKAGGS